MTEESEHPNSDSLQKKIDQAIKRTGDDVNFIAALKFHLGVILASDIDKNEPCELSLKSDDDLCNVMVSKLFIDTMDTYPTRKFESQIDECSGWPVPVLPSEFFGEVKLSTVYRRTVFFQCLKIGDILDCRVTSISPNEYQLRVVHKYGVSRILYDLEIMVVMPRDTSDLSSMQNDFLMCELVRVAVTEIIKDGDDSTKVSVTVNDNRELPEPQLGKLLEKDLPAYVLNSPKSEPHKTYADYLERQTAFKNHLLVNDLMESMGINPRGEYSFFYPDKSLQSIDVKALLKKSKMNYVQHYFDSALEYFKKGDIESAINHLDRAINIFPKKDRSNEDKVQLSNLFQLRGDMYAETEKPPKMTLKAINAWKLAYKTDPNNKSARQSLSNAAFQTACYNYSNNQYVEAAEGAEKALEFDENNIRASRLLKQLKRKHSDFVKIEDESLIALEEERKELVSELKRFREQY